MRRLIIVAAGAGLAAAAALPATGGALPPGGSFVDDDGNIHEGSIEAIGTAGITAGCNPAFGDRFCPGGDVTRAQMATFLVRALGLAAASESRFTDVEGSVHAANIEALREAGMTSGCNPPANDRFCPTDNVTRAQMAAFLTRALGLEPMIPPPRPEIRVEVFASGLDAPIFVDALPGHDRVFIVEKGGRILIVSGGTLLTEPFLDIRDAVLDSGERGLFAVAFHPGYGANGRFFVHCSAAGSGNTVV